MSVVLFLQNVPRSEYTKYRLKIYFLSGMGNSVFFIFAIQYVPRVLTSWEHINKPTAKPLPSEDASSPQGREQSVLRTIKL